MKELKRSALLSAAIVAAMSFLICGCRSGEPEQEASREAARVAVRRIAPESISEKVTLAGEVAPFSSVLLTSKVPGRIEQLSVAAEDGRVIPVAEGMNVSKGQQIAVIDRAVYLAHARRAEAALQSAEAQHKDAAREEERMMALFKDGAATEQARDKSATARMLAEAALMQAKAASELARIDLEESTPESPIDGTIVAKHVDEGNIVAQGAPIVTIQDLTKLKVILNVPDRFLNRIVPDSTRVSLFSDAMGGAALETVVTRVHPAVRAATRTVPIEVLVDNAERRLTPGMFIRAEVEIERKDGVPVARASEVATVEGKTYVYVVRGGMAELRPVRLGVSENERREVIEGLAPGEVVVTQSLRDVADGSAVEITREAAE